jgi:hypothetical protein
VGKKTDWISRWRALSLEYCISSSYKAAARKPSTEWRTADMEQIVAEVLRIMNLKSASLRTVRYKRMHNCYTILLSNGITRSPRRINCYWRIKQETPS